MKKLCLFFFLVFSLAAFGQGSTSLNRFNYQGVLTDTAGTPLMTGQQISLRASVIDTSGNFLFQEVHNVAPNSSGIFKVTIGAGTITGFSIYSDIEQITQISSPLTLRVEIDSSSGYVLMDQKQLFAVPLSVLSKNSLDTLKVSLLTDIWFNSLKSGDVLHFINSSWVNGDDKLAGDTVGYSLHSQSSQYSDTTGYSSVAIPIDVDTCIYSINSGNAAFTPNAVNSVYSDSSTYSNLCQVTDSVRFGWHYKGNPTVASNSFIGTSDSQDLVIKSNNVSRLKITSSGEVQIGNSSIVNSNFSSAGTEGFLYTLTSSGYAFIAPSGTKPSVFFASDSVSFSGGTNSSGQWTASNRGKLSFGFGREILSKGRSGSFVFGDSCSAYATTYGTIPISNTDATNAFVFGKGCVGTGTYSVTIGYQSKALMMRGVSIGYKCLTQRSSAASAYGYEAVSTGSTAVALGYRVKSTGDKSYAMGSMASTNGYAGGFVYGDASSSDTLKSTAINQFKVRASGGTVFYTDAGLTTGVQLFPGSGSWSAVSDSTKKSNFNSIDVISLSSKIQSVKIYNWNYLTDPFKTKHIGPTSQSIFRTGFGEGATTINTVDADGIVLSLIKAEILTIQRIEKRLELSSGIGKEIETVSRDNSDLLKRLNYLEECLSKE